MTRKIIALKLIAVALVLFVIIPSARASAPLEASVWEEDGKLQTIYIAWQPPIPSSQKGDKLNMSVGVLIDGKTYASQNVFDILNIPKCPECSHCKGVTITVDGFTNVYYPLRENAEQSGYSVLWAPDRQENGQKLSYMVHIAKKEMGTNWVQTKWAVNVETGYENYWYAYAYQEDGCWYVDWGDETERIPEENLVIME